MPSIFKSGQLGKHFLTRDPNLKLYLPLDGNALDFSGRKVALREYFNTGDDDWLGGSAAAGDIQGQTFITGTYGHTITSVKLKMYKSGTPGTLTVSIYACDGSHFPTGDALVSSTYDTSGVTTDTGGAWYEIFFSPVFLQPSTEYAIVTSVPNERLYLRCDSSSPAYSGHAIRMSGGSWTLPYSDTLDCVFEIYGSYPDKNNGTVSGAVLTKGKGQNDLCYSFDGSNDSISLPSGAGGVLDITGDLTLFIRVSTTQGQSGCLFGFGDVDPTTAGYVLAINITDNAGRQGLIDLSIGADGWNYFSGKAINDGSEHLIILTIAGTLCSLYIDGKLQDSQTKTGTRGSWSGTRTLGMANEYGKYFSGKMREVAIFSRALSAREIFDYYKWATTKKSQSILAGQTVTPTSKTKGLVYAILSVPSAATKSLAYAVRSASYLTKSLQYCIPTTPAATTKALEYAIRTIPAASEKSAQYAIKSAQVVQKSAQYAILTEQPITAGLVYAVKSSQSVQKGLVYAIESTPSAITKGLAYNVLTQATVQKDLVYIIKSTPSALTKGLVYTILTVPAPIEKSLEYIVVQSVSITKGLQYVILSTPAAITKTLNYDILTSSAITKSLQYAVLATPSAITKALIYAILTTPTPTTKALSYAVLRAISLTKNLQYAVKNNASITKSLQYDILTELSITKSLAYAIKSHTAITKSLEYRIDKELGITKSLQYKILVERVKTKSLTYEVLYDPYELDDSGYTPF